MERGGKIGTPSATDKKYKELLKRQRGRVVSMPDLQSSSPRFKSHSGDLQDLFLVVPSSNLQPCL